MADGVSGTINSISVITQAYLNMSQSTTQGFYNQQSVKVECQKNDVICNNCIQLANNYSLIQNNNYSKACSVCFCTLENINLNSVITLNLSSFISSSGLNSFTQQVLNSITQKATETGTKLFSFTDDQKKSLTENASSIYNILTQNTVQNSLQELKQFQILSLKNSNTEAINVDLEIATTFISKLFQNNLQNSSALASIQNTILQMTTSITQSGFATIISVIVTLAVVFVIGLMCIFAFNIILQILELYAST